jgi:hypothetical protein
MICVTVVKTLRIILRRENLTRYDTVYFGILKTNFALQKPAKKPAKCAQNSPQKARAKKPAKSAQNSPLKSAQKAREKRAKKPAKKRAKT